MDKRITFRVTNEMQEELDLVLQYLSREGLDLDESKLVRFLINKGLEKLKLEGVLKI